MHHTNNFDNMPGRYNPRNLGFYISPDITIEYVRSSSKSESNGDSHFGMPAQNVSENEQNEEDDYADECDPFFNPLTFCAITMDEGDEENVGYDQKPVSAAKVDLLSKVSKKSKTVTAHSNENSSFVCNGTNVACKGATPNSITTSTDATTAPSAVKPKKRHSCPICPKTFGWTTDLKRHLLIHTGERPFKCTMCNATFTRNFLLQKHKTKIHQCLSPNEISQLNNNVAKNLMEIKQKMRELENAKNEVAEMSDECESK